MDPAALRAEFPVLEDLAYLNAGTCGPLPAAALDAVSGVLLLVAGAGADADDVVIRDLAGCGMLRASVGAWNHGADIERLLSALP